MKYIKCDCCGNKIKFGSKIFRFDGYCAIYCSGDCFANAYADEDILWNELAEDCQCEVFDEAYDKMRAQQIEGQISELERKKSQLQEELKTLKGEQGET